MKKQTAASDAAQEPNDEPVKDGAKTEEQRDNIDASYAPPVEGVDQEREEA